MHARTWWFVAGLYLAGLVGISQIAGAAQAAHRSAPAASASDASWAVNQCKAHELYAAYHDCKCIGRAFVKAERDWKPATDALVAKAGNPNATTTIPSPHAGLQHRSSSGPSKEAVLSNLQDSCPNVPGIVHYEYTTCADMHQSDPENYKPFCKCHAEAMAKLYAASPETYNQSGNVQATLNQPATNQCMSLWPQPQHDGG